MEAWDEMGWRSGWEAASLSYVLMGSFLLRLAGWFEGIMFSKALVESLSDA